MSRPDAQFEKRPERVIILDADDPMTEIHGRVVWQEEHDRVVEETRRQAFAEGYSAGQRDAAPTQPVAIDLRRRRRLSSRVIALVLIIGLICLALSVPVLVMAGR